MQHQIAIAQHDLRHRPRLVVGEPVSLEDPDGRVASWEGKLVALGRSLTKLTTEFFQQLIECEDELGERFKTILPKVALSVGLEAVSLQQYMSIVRSAMEDGYWRPALTVGHARAVALPGLTTLDRKGLMYLAEKYGWGCTKLRQEASKIARMRKGEHRKKRQQPDVAAAWDGTMRVTYLGKGKYRLHFSTKDFAFSCHSTDIELDQS